jgi:hypothetical protein
MTVTPEILRVNKEIRDMLHTLLVAVRAADGTPPAPFLAGTNGDRWLCEIFVDRLIRSNLHSPGWCRMDLA